MAERDVTERKVWVLPTELVDRLRAFQTAQGITSEVEAARRLLDAALQMRDTVPDILMKLVERYKTEKDLRTLARDVLWSHPLIKNVNFDDNYVWFEFRDETFGRIDKQGKPNIGERHGGYDIDWSSWQPAYQTRTRTPAPSWEAPKGGGSDLDDEIPF